MEVVRLTSELIASNRRKWQVEALNQRLVSWFAMQSIQLGIAEHDDSHHPFIERPLEEIERGLGVADAGERDGEMVGET